MKSVKKSCWTGQIFICKKNGKYYIEMGVSETEVLRRIDNYLDRLDDYCRKLKANLEQLRQREHDIKEELAKKRCLFRGYRTIKRRIIKYR